ncbi:hypothetical protein [Helicobacter pylori]|uniref:Uncharacterized protein n=2 Tax=Helicobacter pylori TaxID=210 RepID=T1UAT5_HELPX|nr:hypothetical protein [Helicobacter pylori]ADU84719.1 hypothetical protein HPSA_03625 [Helicobacter pylori SouthAfrica7]AGT74032.1 hypothetical protein HPSA20_0796 [Helicobacter pylori SouthAfrica20]WQU98873.1 hypothetical protein KVK26_03540 [Helicobacter pylori]
MNSLEILLNSFKIALIKKDSKQAFSLIERLSLEQLKNLDLETLLSLKEMIAQSIELLEKEKEELQSQMHKAKKIQKFLS